MEGSRSKKILLVGVLSTVAMETVTVVCRMISGVSAAEIHERFDLPLLFRIHHMFWGLLAIAVGAALMKKYEKACVWIIGLGIGLFFSDAVHHAVVLPLWVGNTGWHWP